MALQTAHQGKSRQSLPSDAGDDNLTPFPAFLRDWNRSALAVGRAGQLVHFRRRWRRTPTDGLGVARPDPSQTISGRSSSR